MKSFPNKIVALGLVWLCSCATQSSIRPVPPAEASFESEAGRGGYLRLKVHLENGEELNCMLDTGSPVTLLERVLEPKLGKRFRTYEWKSTTGEKGTNGVYLAPKLYLGDTALLTRHKILTDDLGDVSVRLGMDVLRNYCVQLDFSANKIRFLDPNTLSTNDLGEAFPITFSKRNPVTFHADFLGVRSWMVDTGTPMDWLLTAQHFDPAFRGQQVITFATKLNGTLSRGAYVPKAIFSGNNYSHVFIAELPQNFKKIPDLVGLNFLGRHLVTLNFPGRMMYLKQITGEPLDPANYLPLEAKTFIQGHPTSGVKPPLSDPRLQRLQ